MSDQNMTFQKRATLDPLAYTEQDVNDLMADMAELVAMNERLREALDILQSAMVAKKPIPMPFKQAIIKAGSALAQGEK